MQSFGCFLHYYRNMEANRLLERCRQGDREALGFLYTHYRPQLLRICRQYTEGNDDVAEDLLHDAFVVILTSLDKVRKDDKLESWMTAIVKNVSYHYALQTKQERAFQQQMAAERKNMASHALAPDFEQIHALVAQLPKGYQQVFRLSVFEGLSHQEIGQLLNIAPHTSSSQLFHAKQMLKMLVKKSWVLILLLIALPTALWKMLQKQNTVPQPLTAQKTTEKPQPTPVVTLTTEPKEEIVQRPKAVPVAYQTETETMTATDSIPRNTVVQDTDTVATPNDTKPTTMPATPEYQYASHIEAKRSGWDIKLTYNGQLGQRDNLMANAEISIDPSNNFTNWEDYSWYLNNAIPRQNLTAEARSLIYIATQNIAVNHSQIEARHKHQLPFNVQLTLNRQLTSHLSLETGLSYTRLKSTTETGSPHAFIQEQQQIDYLGIPLRAGYQ